MKEKLEAFARVLTTMDELRSKCPWDKKQTIESLRHLTIEETYELAEAILSKSYEKIKEELGDLLLHIVFYAKIGEEKGEFNIKEVCDTLVEKLIARHPHVYGDVEVNDADEVSDNWEKIKLENGIGSTLGGVPQSLPPLIKASRIQEKARGVGFDWNNSEQVWEKLNEELSEFKAEITKTDASIDKIEDEFGDIIFSIVNYARFYNINPDNALERTNLKFIQRFNKMEVAISEAGKDMRDMPLEEMEEYWQAAKEA